DKVRDPRAHLEAGRGQDLGDPDLIGHAGDRAPRRPHPRLQEGPDCRRADQHQGLRRDEQADHELHRAVGPMSVRPKTATQFSISRMALVAGLAALLAISINYLVGHVPIVPPTPKLALAEAQHAWPAAVWSGIA